MEFSIIGSLIDFSPNFKMKIDKGILKQQNIQFKKTRSTSKKLHFFRDDEIFCDCKRIRIHVTKIKNNHNFCRKCEEKLRKIISEKKDIGNTIQSTVIPSNPDKNTNSGLFEILIDLEGCTLPLPEEHEKPILLKEFEKKSLEERELFNEKIKKNQRNIKFPFGKKRKLNSTDLMNEKKYKKPNISQERSECSARTQNKILSDLRKSISGENTNDGIFPQNKIQVIGNWNFRSVNEIPIISISIGGIFD